MIAALYVATDGAYWNLPDVDPWDEARDARTYPGPHPVVAHPPCQRWGNFYAGSPLAIKQGKRKKLGDDNGCFEAALASLRQFGGVLEHPENSRAWKHFGLNEPPREGGWVNADFHGGWTCRVEQGFYGHFARKPTWLLAYGVELPSLHWGFGERRLDPKIVERWGLKRAIRLGEVGQVGGGGNDRQRIATPEPFRDLLISMARTVKPERRPMTEDRSRQVLINLVASLSLADHMGDAAEDCEQALKQIGIVMPPDYEGGDFDSWLGQMAHYLAHNHSAETVWGTSLKDDEA